MNVENERIEELQKEKFYELWNESLILSAKLKTIISEGKYHSILTNVFLFYVLFVSLGLSVISVLSQNVFLTPTNDIQVRSNFYFFTFVIVAIVSFIILVNRLYTSYKQSQRLRMAEKILELLEQTIHEIELKKDFK